METLQKIAQEIEFDGIEYPLQDDGDAYIVYHLTDGIKNRAALQRDNNGYYFIIGNSNYYLNDLLKAKRKAKKFKNKQAF
jgi:uncharacterized protein YihD (DUF1040 family)